MADQLCVSRPPSADQALDLDGPVDGRIVQARHPDQIFDEIINPAGNGPVSGDRIRNGRPIPQR